MLEYFFLNPLDKYSNDCIKAIFTIGYFLSMTLLLCIFALSIYFVIRSQSYTENDIYKYLWYYCFDISYSSNGVRNIIINLNDELDFQKLYSILLCFSATLLLVIYLIEWIFKIKSSDLAKLNNARVVAANNLVIENNNLNNFNNDSLNQDNARISLIDTSLPPAEAIRLTASNFGKSTNSESKEEFPQYMPPPGSFNYK